MQNNILKKLIACLMSFTLIFLVPTVMASAQVFPNEGSVPKELRGIDFSKEIPKEQQELLKEYYIKDAEKIFSSNYAEQILRQDKIKIKEAILNETIKDGNFYVKENNISKLYSNALQSNRTTSLGAVGDILVTYSFSSFGIDVAAVGHAAIVHFNSNYTIESFPKGGGHADGVRVYTNDWRNKSKVYGIRVLNASYSDYKNASSYALKQANAKKPYNWNFFNKGTTEKFYCSQLVWRAWKNQGFEVDRMNLGNYEPVSPAELVGGSGTYVFYHS